MQHGSTRVDLTATERVSNGNGFASLGRHSRCTASRHPFRFREAAMKTKSTGGHWVVRSILEGLVFVGLLCIAGPLSLAIFG
jgi:hypothetical protein